LSNIQNVVIGNACFSQTVAKTNILQTKPNLQWSADNCSDARWASFGYWRACFYTRNTPDTCTI